MNLSEDGTMTPFVSPYKFNLETSCTLADPILQCIRDKDFVPMIRAIFNAKLFHPIVEVYRYTRTYELGLVMAEYLIGALNDCSNQITIAEWNKWMAHFLMFRLTMLDYLNQWQEYIVCFDQVKQALAAGQLDAYYGYLFSTNRYKIIQRKLDKKNQGRKLGGLLRHQQDRLTPKEIDYRFGRALELLKCAYLSQSGCLWF